MNAWHLSQSLCLYSIIFQRGGSEVSMFDGSCNRQGSVLVPRSLVRKAFLHSGALVSSVVLVEVTSPPALAEGGVFGVCVV